MLNVSSLVLHVSKFIPYVDFYVQFASVSKTQQVMMKEKIFLRRKIKIQKMIVKQYEYYTKTMKLSDDIILKLHPFDVRTIYLYNTAVKKLKEYEELCK